MHLVPTITMIMLSLVFGLLFGFAFDSIFGLLGLYTYTVNNSSSIINGTGLTLGQLMLNDIFSFGLAASTVYCLLPKKVKIKRFIYKKISMIIFSVIFILSCAGLYFVPKSIISLFLGGLAVISFGEGFAIMCNESGPFVSLMRTRKFLSFVTFWINCISVGLLYEFVNWFFPFWVWLPNMEYSHITVESLVILFGYFVVLHPMVIFWQIMQKMRLLQL